MAKSLESLNQRLKRLRMEWGFSQTDWAKAAKVATSQVGRWESTGRGEPSIDSLRGIAALKGITLAALIGDEVPAFAPPRQPTPEEFAAAFIKGSGIDAKRKAICLLALTATPDDVDFIHDSALAAYIEGGEGAATDHKKPLAR